MSKTPKPSPKADSEDKRGATVETKIVFGDDPSVLRSAEQWLNEQGYRLEYEVAQSLENAGFETTLGAVLPGADGTERDVDVLARSRRCELVRQQPYGCIWVEFVVLVECKYSKKKPWMMLGSAKRPGLDGLLAALPHSHTMRAGRRVARRTAARAPLYSLQSMRDAFSRGVVIAHSQRGDEDAYRCLQKVADLSWTLGRQSRVATAGRGAVIVLPLVVVDGWLLASDYAADDKRFRAERRRIGHLLWSGPRVPPTLIDVVESTSLAAYLKLLQATRDELITFATERLRTAPTGLAKSLGQIELVKGMGTIPGTTA